MPVVDYTTLIPPPNNQKPNFMTWLGVLITPLMDAQELLTTMAEMFELDNAVGAQLDILGDVLGVKRLVNFQPTNSADSAILSDDDYKLVLRAKILQNQWKGTTDEVLKFWQAYLPGYPIQIIDNQNMTMDVIVRGLTSSIQQDLVNNGYIIPKPSTVRLSVTFSTEPVFGYDMETDFIQGYDEGNWA